ncbi:hypothetical protein HK104_011373 [Borealophlyctis nickersoniae]|nr:hypothetical protein HK104_011373 [Borealophlyctis nickersoniae]
MVLLTSILLLLASAVSTLSLPTPNYYSEGFPTCHYPVAIPAYDPQGRAYGWENGRSCLVPLEYNPYVSSKYPAARTNPYVSSKYPAARTNMMPDHDNCWNGDIFTCR